MAENETAHGKSNGNDEQPGDCLGTYGWMHSEHSGEDPRVPDGGVWSEQVCKRQNLSFQRSLRFGRVQD